MPNFVPKSKGSFNYLHKTMDIYHTTSILFYILQKKNTLTKIT